MRYVLIAMLALLPIGTRSTQADDPSPQALSNRLDKLKASFADAEKELNKKLQDARSNDDRKQAAFLIKELHALTASDALDLAVEAKRQDAGRDAAIFAVRLLGSQQIIGSDMDKATAILLEHHADSLQIAPALEHMAMAGQVGEAFLGAVAEKTTSPEVKALAMYHTALAMDVRAAAAESPSGDDVKIAALRARAAELMEQAVRLAPDVRVGDKNLARAAETEIVSLRIGPGKPAVDIEGVDLDGKKAKLTAYRGKVVLLDFWATWCGPCREMIPHERELVEKFKARPFVLIGVSVDDETSVVSEFLRVEKMPWVHWWDGPKGPVAKLYRARSFPTLILIDASGKVLRKWVGDPGNETLEAALEEAVSEAEKATKK